MKAILLLSLFSTSSAYININVSLYGPAHCRSRLYADSTDEENDSIGNNDDGSSSFAQSLSERIAQVEENESSFVAGLQKRVKSVARADEFDSAITSNDSGGEGQNPVVVELPVVCLDALLPNQRLSGSTTDPRFCEFLRSFGLGGTFVMTSLNNRQRKIRRFGVIARIELVDVDGDDDDFDDRSTGNEDGYSIDSMLSTPTAVTFSIVGKQRCEILGPADGMKEQIGRWRRGYDPDGEESRLGWGEERFVDKSETTDVESEVVSGSSSDENLWITNTILIIDEESKATTDTIAKATYIIPLIERWMSLASDQTTYDNTDVIAATRRKAGQPGLKVNAKALIRKVQQELGPMPSPECPIAFALWGAALLNPLPALGVATEIRGAVLEAEGAEKKLGILERGLIKSINNLDGTRPLM